MLPAAPSPIYEEVLPFSGGWPPTRGRDRYAGVKATYDDKNGNADNQTVATISSTFASSNLDLILAVATPSAQGAAGAIADKPALFTAVTDPVDAKLVASMDAPGANVTGTSDMNPVGEQLALVTELHPDAKRVGIIYSSGEPNSVIQVELARKAAPGLGLGLVEHTGDNERMIRAQGVSTDNTKILGLALSNALVGLCGALIAQYQGYADIGMGIGLIIAGLASVIIGQTIVSSRRFVFATAAVVLGSVVYLLVIQLALQIGLNPNDMKLMSAALVVAALLSPRLAFVQRFWARRRQRMMAAAAEGEEVRA